MKKCKLVIKDEVNCQFVGLDVVERRLLSNKFKYEIPYARHLPSVRLGRWDGCIAFFQTSGSTYINLLYEILPILDQRGWDVELEDLRQSKLNFEFEPVDENSFQHITWPEGHPVAGQPIILRDYQQNIVNEFLANPQSLSEVATSAGKTIITAALSYKVEPYGRSIIIVPNTSLVLQTYADYINMRLDVGVYFGDKKEYDRKHTICTWQSLGNLLKKTKDQTADITIDEFLKDVVCVIVDECFDENTLITTPTGVKKIKDIQLGDEIINFCEKTKTYKVDTIVKVHKNLTNSLSEPMLELTFDNDKIIKCTANHKFLTNKGWVRADQLTDDIEVIDINTYN